MYRDFINFYTANFQQISIFITIVVTVLFIVIKGFQKKWNKTAFKFEKIIALIFTSSSIPTIPLLFFCCFDISILEKVQGIGLYIFIAGVCLIYVVGTAIWSFLRDTD